ncbi:MAG: hypothetical protein WCX88_00315 [Patescibacteria group bacterium]
MQSNQGFTRLEILLVVGIIGILGILSIILLNNCQQKTRDAQRLSDVRQIEAGLQMYYTEGSSFSGACLDQGEGSVLKTILCNATNNPYISWANYQDPDFSSLAACDSTTSATKCSCAYGLQIVNKDEYRLYFCLEKGANGIGKGLHSISRNGFDK